MLLSIKCSLKNRYFCFKDFSSVSSTYRYFYTGKSERYIKMNVSSMPAKYSNTYYEILTRSKFHIKAVVLYFSLLQIPATKKRKDEKEVLMF